MRILFLVVLAVLIIGCTSANKEKTITDVDVQEFAKLAARNDVFVLDVHTPEQEHIKGTDAFLPYNDLESHKDSLPADKNTPIALYCRSGSMSREASQALQEMGYARVYNLLGGSNAWKAAGLELNSKQFGEYGALSRKATVFKSPTCGCCVGYVAELEKQGFEVNVVSTTDMSSIKHQYNIPGNMGSCHTMVIGDYFVEGHVPIEAVNALLEEQPNIDGIALPNMPSGSPGMPGAKKAAFRIYSLSDGEISDFMTI